MSIIDKIKGKKTKKEEVTNETKQVSVSEDSKKDLQPKQGGKLSYRVLVAPLITEKSTKDNALGKYVFQIYPSANKIVVKKAVEELYGVKVEDVNIVRIKGKNVHFGKISGRTSDLKKAIVTLKKGETLNIENL